MRDAFAVLRRTFAEFRADNLTDWAAALTYYGLLSLFPALIALVSILGLVGDPETTTRKVTEVITEIGPDSAAETFAGPVRSIASSRGTAGVALRPRPGRRDLVGLGLRRRLHPRLQRDLRDATEGRPFWKLRPLQIAITLVDGRAGALLARRARPQRPCRRRGRRPARDRLDRGHPLERPQVAGDGARLHRHGQRPLLHLARRRAARLQLGDAGQPGGDRRLGRSPRPASPLYVANFGSYDKTYGTLGGLVALLVWLWITNLAILFGAELNLQLERASRELLDDLRVERLEVVGLAAADQPLVDVDLLVDPLGAGVAQVGLQARPRGERAAVDDVGLDQRPRPVADRRRPACRPRRRRGRTRPPSVSVRSWSGLATPPGSTSAVVVAGVGIADGPVGLEGVALVEVVEGLDLAGFGRDQVDLGAGLAQRPCAARSTRPARPPRWRRGTRSSLPLSSSDIWILLFEIGLSANRRPERRSAQWAVGLLTRAGTKPLLGESRWGSGLLRL